MLIRLPWISIVLLALAVGCVREVPATGEAAPALEAASEVRFGNGVDNRIVIEGFTRSGRTFRFEEVEIAGDGWLVMHPFAGGRPDGKTYVASTFLRDGINRDVEISLATPPEPGTKFLVMLHRDVNRNRVFDFVFLDDRNVLDHAVFEGATMIAHTITAP